MTAMMILGAAVWQNGPSPTLLRRVEHAAEVFHKTPCDLVLPCGGLGRYPPSEAEAMRELLIARGVPADRIVLEDRSTTTFENLAFAKALLDARGIADVLIVSDAYHGPRALMVARALGLEARFSGAPHPAPWTPRYARQITRESLARIGYRMRLRRLVAVGASAPR